MTLSNPPAQLHSFLIDNNTHSLYKTLPYPFALIYHYTPPATLFSNPNGTQPFLKVNNNTPFIKQLQNHQIAIHFDACTVIRCNVKLPQICWYRKNCGLTTGQKKSIFRLTYHVNRHTAVLSTGNTRTGSILT